jgi:Zn-dependent M28 family amino/carboxypeptidase
VRGQYVAIGSHNDHVGFLPGQSVDHDSLRATNLVLRPEGAEGAPRRATESDRQRIRVMLDSLRRLRPARRDSIFNGADDDASGSMGMLEIAEALASAPAKPRRSVLFVWHTAEELGLFGAQYFTDNPTVPRDSIVAQINVDMIGRGGSRDLPGGGPGYLQLIGSRRLSTELGDVVEAVNRRRARPFSFDYQYDATGHPQQFYCRSDHYMYARYGIPVVFMSTGGHVDYHMPTDEPQYLDYDKLRDVTQFIHDVAVEIANRPARLVVDKPKPDPRGSCVQ